MAPTDTRGQDARYDLALVDPPFPRRDGVQRAADIAARHSDMPLIAVSADFFPPISGDREVIPELTGVIEAPAKPLASSEIGRCVARVLQHAGA